MKKTLSIVVPTYNMEFFLRRCLDSLVATDSILSDLQIIVVNDGSRDRSSEIAHEYENNYPQTFVVIDKENGNYGSCVNAGLEKACGKYFRILDADDCFYNQGLVKFVGELKKVDVDAAFTNYEIITEGKKGSDVVQTNVETFGIIYSLNDKNLLSLHPQFDFAMHKITYKTELLKRCNLKLSEGISYTDTEYVYYPMRSVDSVIFYNFVLYKYYIGRIGQTVEVSSKIKNSFHLRVIIDRLLDNEMPIDPHSNKDIQLEKILCFICSSYYHIFLVLSSLTKEGRERLKTLDKVLLERNRSLYVRLSKVRCMGLPYIKIWRTLGIQIIKPWLYFVVKKVIR